ncbi:hypothetical protein QQM79_15845 [Marinobacteraceae bacterium S3BR75-40.1]
MHHQYQQLRHHILAEYVPQASLIPLHLSIIALAASVAGLLFDLFGPALPLFEQPSEWALWSRGLNLAAFFAGSGLLLYGLYLGCQYWRALRLFRREATIQVLERIELMAYRHEPQVRQGLIRDNHSASGSEGRAA